MARADAAGAAVAVEMWTRRGKKRCHVTLVRHPLWGPIILLETYAGRLN